MAAHCDAYSRSCSNTSRTARSRTSGEYFFACLMTPISQELESPANPGRFSRRLVAPGLDFRIRRSCAVAGVWGHATELLERRARSWTGSKVAHAYHHRNGGRATTGERVGRGPPRAAGDVG